MGDIGEGAVVDLAVESERLAEEDGGRGVAIGDGGHIHAYIISIYYMEIKLNYNIYMTTHSEINPVTLNKTNGFSF
jgi:hypothetical protein